MITQQRPLGERYTVECKKHIVADYAHCDTQKLNQISKDIYKELRTQLGGGDATKAVSLDDLLLVTAMVVARMAHTIDSDDDNPNNWANDAWPEFCSLIGPASGMFLGKK